MRYSPPSAADLRKLKDSLNKTSEEMAELFALAGGQQWRKYTGGESPRVMGEDRLFYAAARLALTDEELRRVYDKMREIGADLSE
ncbi:Uncharacterised protein [Burkholderia pseudomallei]|nr:hypothetical protein [Burkholderia pseudomallei]KGV07782.1 hypothetical protein X895_365 [Burkholderia pseudomallei MSHR4503]KGV49376.1 hypothetical protein X900_5740 [Burkholderia pseudomallei BDU 2]AIV78489.1 hypothetical protein X994_1366 [Burkholderia pseudomallei]KGC37648.1 hypothetical protein DO62_5133 [Burkholderia pseudomallei]KGD06125.1 hypothetical protein DO63_2267 [Burkholderia pseudomallei]